MESIHIDATERSPEVSFDFDSNIFTIRGESYPEDVPAFYGPVIRRLVSHFEAIRDCDVIFEFELVYFNSTSAKILMGLFETLEEAAAKGNRVTIVWRYEADDDNMEELGQEFGEDLEHAIFKMAAKD